MCEVAEFTANAWGWIFLCGLMVACVLFGFILVLVERNKWLARREAEKMDAAEIKRFHEIAERVRQM